MSGNLVSIAFWSFFLIAALPALLFLLGTLLRESLLATGRMHVDDGSDDPSSAAYRVYLLSRASATLAAAALTALVPLAAAGILAAAGTTLASAAFSLLLAYGVLIVSDILRTRQARLEDAFLQLSGITVSEAYARVVDLQPAGPPPSVDRTTAR